MATNARSNATEADLLRMPKDGRKYELVDGVLDKVGEYLEAGVRMVWVLDPEARTASVYRSLTNVQTLSKKDALSGEDVLPGFRCRLGEIL